MGLRYTIEFNNIKNQSIRVEIDDPNYSDTPTQIEPAGNPLIHEYNGNNDDDIFKSHVVPSSIILSVVSTGLDLETLMYISDATHKCRMFVDGLLKFSGFLISDGIQEKDSGVPYDVTITAIDGVELLGNVSFEWGDNYPAIIVDGVESVQRVPMNVIRLALYRQQNLDNRLPIRWNTSLKSNQYPTSDMLSGLNRINSDGKLTIYSENTNLWYLENICKTALSWMYQKDGYWNFTNYFDVINNLGNYTGHQITDDTSTVQTAEVYNDNVLQVVENTDVYNETWFWTGKKPLRGVNVTYNDTTNDGNVVPNGGFDRTVVGSLLDWSIVNINPSNPAPFYGLADSLNEREGNSVRLTQPAPADLEGRFSFLDSIPLDSKFLFKTFNFGFTFSPSQYGFSRDANGTILWDDNPLKISVRYSAKGRSYFLNEFGYWQFEARGQDVGVEFIRMDRTTSGVSPNLIYVFHANFEGSPNVGDVLAITIKNAVGSSATTDYSFTVTLAEEGFLEAALNGLLASLPGSIDGWSIGNKQVTMETSTKGVVRFSHYIGLGDSTARTYKSGAVQQYQFIFPKIDNLKVGDVATINFSGKGNQSGAYLPEIESLQPDENGKLKIMFYVKSGQVYTIDDVYFTVDNAANDLFEIRNTNSKASIENYEVSISSSFSGHMWSNYMDGYASSDDAMFWQGVDKTLTQLYGEKIMDMRNMPRKIFSGTIDKIIDWGLFTLMGKTYAPLSIRVDYAQCISEVVAIEIGENPINYSVTHKSSSDQGDS